MIRNTSESQTVADLRMAVNLGRPVTIDYERADGTRTVRVVEPFEVVGPEDAVKRPFFRAMDRLSHDFRSFRFDRLYAYRVSNRRGRNRVERPARKTSREVSVPVASGSVTPIAPSGLDDGWADWLELTYDPDAPVPFLPTDLEA
jgi:predicted DNA-binding transcriptional regulator YafY